MSGLPDNAKKSFKCSRCGHMFPQPSQDQAGGDCPVCGNHCDQGDCRVVDASDQGY